MSDTWIQMVSRMECLLRVWIKKRRLYTIKICLCFLDERQVCDHLSLWSDLSYKHFRCMSKGNKLFQSKKKKKKKVVAILSKKMRLGNFCILVKIFCFPPKHQNRVTLFFMLSTKQGVTFFSVFFQQSREYKVSVGR